MTGVAVVVTVYKRYDFVERAIRSVVPQMTSADELVVVADSPENLSFAHERVRTVRCDSPYWGECIVRGVQETTKDLIFF